MRREANATAILTRLLERHERASGSRRIIERPAQSFEDPADLRALVELLADAAQAGAVEIGWDRDAPHLIERVTLVDASRLYAFTGRIPRAEILTTAIQRLSEVETRTEPARTLAQDIATAWSDGERLVSLGIEDVDDAVSLIRAADATFTELPGDIPLRTRSARLMGDSKALERALPTLIAYLRQAGIVDAKASREEVLGHLGLGKYALPVLVGGSVLVGGIDVVDWPYVGVPPELVADVGLSAPIRSILTVENLESFNRHVRTCRAPGDVVVYSGGFPSSTVLALLRTLLKAAGTPLHHWGDIDPGGARIGYHLETSLHTRVIPHLMQADLAEGMGTIPERPQLVPNLPDESAFVELADYLRAPHARWLEQEGVDPQPIVLKHDEIGRSFART